MCGICGMFRAQVGSGTTPDFNGQRTGCVAVDSTVVSEARGVVPVGDIAVGDRILGRKGAVGAALEYHRVIFTHDHVSESATVVLEWRGGEVEMTGMHSLPVLGAGGWKDVMAKDVAEGNRIAVWDEAAAALVTREVVTRRPSAAMVRYVVTEGDAFLASRALVSLYSTPAGALETLPFRFLDMVWEGALTWSPVRAALRDVRSGGGGHQRAALRLQRYPQRPADTPPGAQACRAGRTRGGGRPET